jgi:hypothetical protein
MCTHFLSLFVGLFVPIFSLKAHASLAWHLLFWLMLLWHGIFHFIFLHSPYSLFEKHWREICDMESFIL